MNPAFKVILIGAGRNPERCDTNADVISETYEDNCNGKTANSSISTTPPRFEDVPARNAFEYLQMIYIARN